MRIFCNYAHITLQRLLDYSKGDLKTPFNHKEEDFIMSILQPRINDDSIFQYDIEMGACYLWCCWSLISQGLCIPCYCFARKYMNSQEVRIENNKIHYKSDCWVCREDKMVPLDRIQDINIGQNCCQRMFGITDISIQTAGGGERPEIVITAAKNPVMVRDAIMAKRDAHAGISNGTDGVSSDKSPLLGSEHSVDIRNTLLRIEKLVEKGVDGLELKTMK